jgi:uncharacterized metal-binding protein YceD (DUF177 family)
VQAYPSIAASSSSFRTRTPNSRALVNFDQILDSAAHFLGLEGREDILDGDDKALVVNDCVDLTPYLRDDIFLAFPQHPLCSPQCDGLANLQKARLSGGGEPKAGSPVWEQLNKLKL